MMFDPFPPIETARLRLRCVAAEDAAPTAGMMTPDISRWLANWPVPFTCEMAVDRIEALRDAAFRKEALPFAVIDRARGQLVGWVIVDRDIGEARRGSLGYWLGEKHHGKGYMGELAPVVIAAAFDLLDLDVIEAGAQPENAASFAVMTRCGMTKAGEGTVHVPARQRDEFCYFYEVRRPAAKI